MDKPAPFPQSQPAGTAMDRQMVQLVVPGMGSDHCAGLVSSSIRRLTGISDISTNIANHKVAVRFDPAQASAETIKDAIERAGYEVAGVSESAGAGAAATGCSCGQAKLPSCLT